MSKLSPASPAMISALKAFHERGDFPAGTRDATITGLIKRELLTDQHTITLDGLKAIGAEHVPIDNDTDVKPLADRPYVVEMLYRDNWVMIPNTDSRTWGRANILRMRMASQGNTVRIVDTTDNRVCA
jgi:hypothetical protein